MSGDTTSHVIAGPRRLAAILAADIAGYSRLMGADEEGTLARMKRIRREVIEPTLQEHYGRLVKNTGDGFLAIFDSPLEAVRCAIVIQQSVAARNTSLPRPQWIQYRIGVNLGDVIVDPDDIYGEGVNIAARLETIAEPGGVNISGGVYEQIKNKLVCGYQSLGDEKLKNITDPVRIYRVLPDPSAVSRATRRGLRWTSFAPAVLLAFIGAGLYAYTFDLYPGGRSGAPLPAAAAIQDGAPIPESGLPGQMAATAPRPALPPASPATIPGLPPAPAPVETPVSVPAQPASPASASPQPAPPSAAPSQVAVVAPPPSRPPEPGTAFRDCAGCPEMVRLAGGSFRMGSDEDPSEKPVRTVRVEPFALGRYPVTVGEWNRCVAAKACAVAAPGEDSAPVRNVSWTDAQQYVAWLKQTTGQEYRLPTEAEWEYAARGGTASRYWWGERVVAKMANCRGCTEPYDPRQPVNVGSFPPNPFGLHDLTGGVAQWVADCWHPDYQGAASDGSARTAPNCREHVLRGGSWRNDASYARSASRTYYDTGIRYPAHGFRVARSY